MPKFTILTAISTGENFERDEHIIVNHIGEACYLDFNRLDSKELHEIANFKRFIEKDQVGDTLDFLRRKISHMKYIT